MTEDADYKFEVSLSDEVFVNKEISNAMTGSTKDEENRKIRKRYGFKSNRGTSFRKTEVTIRQLYDSMISGKCFTNIFSPKQFHKDGTFGLSEKKDENFEGAYTIGVDIDDTNYSDVEDYVSALSLKPSFYYTSYSNMQYDKNEKFKGARFRLIYVFDSLIQNKYFFRYCAWCLNRIIEEDVQEKITDDCNLRCSQYFNGTNATCEGIHFSSGITNLVYSLDDINVTKDGFVDFLRNRCFYKSLDAERKKEIGTLLFSLQSAETTTFYNDCQNETTTFFVNPNFLSDIDRLDYDEFVRFHRHKYRYIYRKEKDFWIDNTYQYIDDDYFQLYYNVKRVMHVEGKSHRRKKIFERMCLRRILEPTITPHEMIYNAYEDVHRFFDNSDGVFNSDYYYRNCRNCFEMSIEDIEQAYSKNIAYLKKRSPKSKIIFKRGMNFEIGAMNSFRKSLRLQIISENINADLSFKENLEYLNTYVFAISERTLRRYYKELDLKIDEFKLTDDEIAKIIDTKISLNQNYRLIKDTGIKIGKIRFGKIYREKKEKEKGMSTYSHIPNYDIKTSMTFKIRPQTTSIGGKISDTFFDFNISFPMANFDVKKKEYKPVITINLNKILRNTSNSELF